MSQNKSAKRDLHQYRWKSVPNTFVQYTLDNDNHITDYSIHTQSKNRTSGKTSDTVTEFVKEGIRGYELKPYLEKLESMDRDSLKLIAPKYPVYIQDKHYELFKQIRTELRTRVDSEKRSSKHKSKRKTRYKPITTETKSKESDSDLDNEESDSDDYQQSTNTPKPNKYKYNLRSKPKFIIPPTPSTPYSISTLTINSVSSHRKATSEESILMPPPNKSNRKKQNDESQTNTNEPNKLQNTNTNNLLLEMFQQQQQFMEQKFNQYEQMLQQQEQSFKRQMLAQTTCLKRYMEAQIAKCVNSNQHQLYKAPHAMKSKYYKNKIIKNLTSYNEDILDNNIHCLFKLMDNLHHDHPDIIKLQINSAKFDKIIQQQRKYETERYINSGNKQYMDGYLTGRFIITKNKLTQINRFTGGTRDWLLSPDEVSILSQPRKVINKMFSFTTEHFKVFHYHGLTQYDIYRQECRVYQYGEPGTDGIMNMITFMRYNASFRFYIFRCIKNDAYLNGSGMTHYYHFEKILDKLCNVEMKKSYVIENIENISELGCLITVNNDNQLRIKNQFICKLGLSRDTLSTPAGWPKCYTLTASLLRGLDAVHGVNQSDSHTWVMDIGTVKDGSNVYARFDALQDVKPQGVVELYFGKKGGKDIYYEQPYMVLGMGDLHYTWKGIGSKDGFDIFGLMIRTGKKANRDSILYFSDNIIHGIDMTNNTGGYEGYEIVFHLTSTEDNNNLEYYRTIEKGNWFLPEKLKEYKDNNKKLPTLIATTWPQELLYKLWAFATKTRKEIKSKDDPNDKLTEEELDGLVKEYLWKSFGVPIYRQGNEIYINGIGFCALHNNLRTLPNRMGTQLCTLYDTFNIDEDGIIELAAKVIISMPVAKAILTKYCDALWLKSYGKKLVQNVTGDQAVAILDFLGYQIIHAANMPKCTTDDMILFLALEFEIYLHIYGGHLFWTLSSYTKNQFNEISNWFISDSARKGLLCEIFEVQVNDYLWYSFGSFILTAIFFFQQYKLVMEVMAQHANERRNLHIKGAASMCVRSSVKVDDETPLANVQNENGETIMDYKAFPRVCKSNCASQAFVTSKYRDLGDFDFFNVSFGMRNMKKIKQKQRNQSNIVISDKVKERRNKLLNDCKNERFKEMVNHLENMNVTKNKQVTFVSKDNINKMKKIYSKGHALTGKKKDNKN
eukprot:32273_1